jgi:hypothetical protein
MLHRNERVSRLLSRLTLLFFVASPAPPVVAAVEESRSTLHTYTPAATNDPGPFHCNDCWGLKPRNVSRCRNIRRHGIDVDSMSGDRARTRIPSQKSRVLIAVGFGPFRVTRCRWEASNEP